MKCKNATAPWCTGVDRKANKGVYSGTALSSSHKKTSRPVVHAEFDCTVFWSLGSSNPAHCSSLNILLAGDVHPNPGPPAGSWTCSVCLGSTRPHQPPLVCICGRKCHKQSVQWSNEVQQSEVWKTCRDPTNTIILRLKVSPMQRPHAPTRNQLIMRNLPPSLPQILLRHDSRRTGRRHCQGQLAMYRLPRGPTDYRYWNPEVRQNKGHAQEERTPDPPMELQGPPHKDG